MKINIKKSFIRIMIVLTMFVLSFNSVALDLKDNKNPNESYQEKKFIKSNDYYKITNSKIKEKISNYIKANPNKTLYGVATSKVYVIETKDDVGNIINSRLMTNAEVEKYKSESQTITLDSYYYPAATETKGELDIYLTVWDNGNYTYELWGDAYWTNGVWTMPDGENLPDVGDDFIALTWGGSGELQNISNSISGSYQMNQGNISFSKSKSDSYRGYCWQFAETKPAGLLNKYFADSIESLVYIGKTYPQLKNKKTNIKLTYIHTYQATVGSIAFLADSDLIVAPSISLSSCAKQWQIEVDVPNILY